LIQILGQKAELLDDFETCDSMLDFSANKVIVADEIWAKFGLEENDIAVASAQYWDNLSIIAQR